MNAPGVLEPSTSTPWAYAHPAKSIMAHVRGKAVFQPERVDGNINHYDLVKYLARHDHAGYVPVLRYLQYPRTVLWYPEHQPMPIP